MATVGVATVGGADFAHFFGKCAKNASILKFFNLDAFLPHFAEKLHYYCVIIALLASPAESSRVESSRAEPSRVESSRVESSRVESSRLASSRAESSIYIAPTCINHFGAAYELPKVIQMIFA